MITGPSTLPIPPTVAPRQLAIRIVAIDVLRGITIAFMILVNDPGDWAHVYPQLDHAEWNGWTLTDLVFPTFLFLVGASTVFSLDARIRRGNCRRTLALHILGRSAKIFALDLFLAAFPLFHLTQLRLYGVLTRIALCYLAGGLILLLTRSPRILAVISGALLAGYWALLRFVPVPGFGVPTRDVPFLDKYANLVAWLDRAVTAFLQRTIHTGVLYERTRDPEGLLSTLPAVATVLIGAMAGLWLKQHLADGNKARNGLLIAGIASFAAGLLWNPWFPINKNLWTSSYVLMAAGWALLGLGLFVWLLDGLRLQTSSRTFHLLTRPALIFGSNAITAYAVSSLLGRTMTLIKVNDGEKLSNAWAYTYQHVFARGNSTRLTSLAFAIAVVAVCFIPNWLLYRRKIFLKL